MKRKYFFKSLQSARIYAKKNNFLIFKIENGYFVGTTLEALTRININDITSMKVRKIK